jgi:hypothetical protein
LSKGDDDASEVNRFFHLTFSHNLSFTGAALALVGITLLELNHVTSQVNFGLWGGIVRGLILGGAFILGTYNYTRYTGGDVGRWSDLKVMFIVVWIAFIVLLYAIKRLDPRMTDYELLLPSLLSFSLMAILGFVLVFRRVKRGFKIYVSRKRIRKLMLLTED